MEGVPAPGPQDAPTDQDVDGGNIRENTAPVERDYLGDLRDVVRQYAGQALDNDLDEEQVRNVAAAGIDDALTEREESDASN